MARTDARVKLLDAALVAAITQGADVFGGDFKRWCELNQIPRSTAYRHKKRIEEEGRWAPRSQRPESCPHHTPEPVEAAVVRLRTSLGRENGADNIGYHLTQIAAEQGWAERGWTVPCRATINKILTRHGLVVPEPKKKPKSSYRRFAYAQPRDCYQIDATEVRLAGTAKAVVFEVLDDCSRVLVATHAADAETGPAAIAAIQKAFTDFGVPALVLSDNGSAFTSRTTKGGTSKFTRAVTTAGARLIHSSPYHPQTCGKVERHHRTFKAWLTDQPAPTDLTQLQALCDRYQHDYNTRRRHSAWNQPPQQAWDSATSYGGPGHLPVQRDADVRVLATTDKGNISIGPVVVNLTKRYARQSVTVLLDGDQLTVYDTTGQPIGHLHIDFTKTYQPIKAA